MLKTNKKTTKKVKHQSVNIVKLDLNLSISALIQYESITRLPFSQHCPIP